MFRTVAFTTLFALGLFATNADAAKLIKRPYKSPKDAARGAAAYRLTTNSAVFQSLGVITARRVHTAGAAKATPAGKALRYRVVTFKKAGPGDSAPFAEVKQVTVFKQKNGDWRAYRPGKSQVRITKKNPLRSLIPRGWFEVGMEDWIETYGAEGEHIMLPNGNVAIPRYDAGGE